MFSYVSLTIIVSGAKGELNKKNKWKRTAYPSALAPHVCLSFAYDKRKGGTGERKNKKRLYGNILPTPAHLLLKFAYVSPTINVMGEGGDGKKNYLKTLCLPSRTHLLLTFAYVSLTIMSGGKGVKKQEKLFENALPTLTHSSAPHVLTLMHTSLMLSHS